MDLLVRRLLHYQAPKAFQLFRFDGDFCGSYVVWHFGGDIVLGLYPLFGQDSFLKDPYKASLFYIHRPGHI